MDMIEMKALIKQAVREVLAEQTKPMDLLYAFEGNLSTTTFYNPAIAAFGMSISIQKGSVQIHIAEPFDKNNRGFAKPGEKRYDHEHPFVFGLTVNECHMITENFEALLAGTYQRPVEPGKTIDPKYVNVMEFMHKTRKFYVGPISDRSGHQTLKVGIYDQERGKTTGYIFRADQAELKIFRSFLSNAVTLVPVLVAVIGGISKSAKSAIYDINTKNGTTVAKPATPSVNNDNDDFGFNPSSTEDGMFEESSPPTQTTSAPTTVSDSAPWEDTPSPAPSQIPGDDFDPTPSQPTVAPQATKTVGSEGVDWGF